MRGWFSVRAGLIALGAGLALLWAGPSVGAPAPPPPDGRGVAEPRDARLSWAPSGAAVCLNEVLAQPCGAITEQFVELYNPSDEEVPLGGWSVYVSWNGLPLQYTLPMTHVIPAGGFVTLWQRETNLELPSSFSIQLLDATGEGVDVQLYLPAPCGTSRGLVPDGVGVWSGGVAPSPGGPNVLATMTPSPTASITPEDTATPSTTPSRTPTATSTRKPTRTPTATSTPKPTRTPTATSTPSPTPSRTPMPTALIPKSVCLSEFLPAPGSDVDWDGDGHADHLDEWIELYNNLDRDLDLTGWMLDDAAGSGSYPYILPEGTVLRAGEYRPFYRRTTKVTLNNAGDAVHLLAPNGVVVEAARYTTAAYDVAYSRRRPCSGPWLTNWNPTPGERNVLVPCESPGNGGCPTYLPVVRRQPVHPMPPP